MHDLKTYHYVTISPKHQRCNTSHSGCRVTLFPPRGHPTVSELQASSTLRPSWLRLKSPISTLCVEAESEVAERVVLSRMATQPARRPKTVSCRAPTTTPVSPA